MARLTGLEPATSGVTGRHSNQLSYNRPLPADLHQRGVLLGTDGGTVKHKKRLNHGFLKSMLTRCCGYALNHVNKVQIF